ncbi:hypothetical protein [Kouleothrix sp.]|uniref:hypothetical protein n=1 Tax=Kouleothrix sp. TaxID=2779161 RepID=UPI00391CEB29
MDEPQRLLARLDAIGRALRDGGQALALLGLGSVGRERNRIDAFSDLDFFVVARDGARDALLADLGWLAAAAPVAYAFRNTADGYKLLYADGIFCEFAVFEAAALAGVPFAAGQVVWHAEEFDPARLEPPPRAQQPRPAEWLLGEALTNLYIGLGRFHRGEKLSAARFIQGYALDRVLELAATLEPAQPGHPDPFAPERRFEQRFPQTARHLPDFAQGYERSVESARAILAFLAEHFAVNAALARAIEARCA